MAASFSSHLYVLERAAAYAAEPFFLAVLQHLRHAEYSELHCLQALIKKFAAFFGFVKSLQFTQCVETICCVNLLQLAHVACLTSLRGDFLCDNYPAWYINSKEDE